MPLMEGPSFGAHVVSRICVGPTVRCCSTQTRHPSSPTGSLCVEDQKCFRVVVWPLGEVVGVASVPEGLPVVLAARPYVEEVPVLHFDKDFSLLTTVVYT